LVADFLRRGVRGQGVGGKNSREEKGADGWASRPYRGEGA
jgi:hypothetical protein